MERGCDAPSWRTLNENKTMGPYMSMAGYKTAFFGGYVLSCMLYAMYTGRYVNIHFIVMSNFTGKYLNNYGEPGTGADLTHIPPGWTRWFTLQGNRYVCLSGGY